jgi:double-strand break repair protein MRE11
MVLLAGDLFHDNKPSRRALQRCMETLRDHVLGPREVTIEVVSDQNANFHDKYRQVNFEDANFNVQLPVFAIHGNHDDPAGDGGLAALDLMSTANLVNYFGRAPDVSAVKLYPIMIQKGITKLALYGLGHIRDERLHRALERKEVSVSRPSQDTKSWFNLMAIHQNRHERGAGADGKKGYVKESQLPSCMDIIVWGHEHKCEIASGVGNESAGNHFMVIQPGSTVATSLVQGEAEPKHVGILEIRADQYKFTPIKLETVRPFIIKDVVLQDYEQEHDFNDEPSLVGFLEEQVEQALAKLKAQHPVTPTTKAAENRLKFPLVRLRVDYSGYSTCNPQRFGQRFVESVANPSDILLFTRKAKKRAAASASEAERVDAVYEGGEPDDARTQIQSLVAEFLQKGTKEQLRLLSEEELNTAVFEEYVAKENKSAIANAVEEKLRLTRELLRSERASGLQAAGDRKAKEAYIEDVLSKHAQRGAAPAPAGASSSAAAGASSSASGAKPAPKARPAPVGKPVTGDLDKLDWGSDDDDVSPKPAPAARGRAGGAGRAAGRGRARGPAAGRGRGGGRQTKLDMTGVIELSDGDDDEAATAGSSAGAAVAGKKRAAPAESRAPKRQAAAPARKYSEMDEGDDIEEDEDGGVSVVASSKRSFAGKRRMK